MKNKIALVVTTGLFLFGLFYISYLYYEGYEADKIGFLAQENASSFVRDYSPVKGVDEATVYLVEFLDPECEACRAFYPFVKTLMTDYKKDLKVVVRYAPFHRNSQFAVRILEAARLQGRYWEVLEVLFANQPQWASHHDPKPELIWDFLPQVGVDVDKIKEQMNTPEIERRIKQDIDDDGKKLGVRQTPTFFVNGKPLREFGPEPLRKLIEEEINRTKQ